MSMDLSNWTESNNTLYGYFKDKNGNECELFKATLYKKGTLHLYLNCEFVLRLNIEFGKMYGWIQCANDIVDEFNVSHQDAEQMIAENQYIPVEQAIVGKAQLTLSH
jgi:hypothetical protein